MTDEKTKLVDELKSVFELNVPEEMKAKVVLELLKGYSNEKPKKKTKKKSDGYFCWTKSEWIELAKHYENGKTPKQISVLMDQPVKTIKKKVYTLRHPKYWTKTMKEALLVQK